MTDPAGRDPLEVATDKLMLSYQGMLEHAGRPNGNVRVRDFGTLISALGDCMQAFARELSATSQSVRDLKAAVLDLETRLTAA